MNIDYKVVLGISYWQEHIKQYGEYSRKLGQWFPKTFYTCALCGHSLLHIENECPNCKSKMNGIRKSNE